MTERTVPPLPEPHTPQTLNDRGMFLLFESFTDHLAKDVVQWILESNFKSGRKYKNLNLVVCSPGGSLPACFAIIDTVRGSSLPVHTTALGMIASCGLLTFISGAPGHRILTPNTSILSHQFSWGSFGKEHELFASVREFELTVHRMIEHYKKCTGLDEETIRKKLLPPQDVWMSAEEAVELGIADAIARLS